MNGNPLQQSRNWLLTVPHYAYTPFLPTELSYVKGQLELGDGGFLHWQILAIFKKKSRLGGVVRLFGQFHAEPVRTLEHALEYVHKDETSVHGTRFQLGEQPFNRAVAKDWEDIKQRARAGELDSVPADVYIRCYQALRTIARDNLKAEPMQRKCYVYWGNTGTGKSRKAWDLAGWDAYPKDPNTKFWDGYQNSENVVIDEFRGLISISHMLRWLDRYPVIVEIKGSAIPLRAKNIWITSNLNPRSWYPDAGEATVAALLRRLTITKFEFPVLINNE